jgi:twitching motility two-component system response regulator PilG
MECRPSTEAQDTHARSPFSFADDLDNQPDPDPMSQAISWLLKQPYIEPDQVSTLIKTWTQSHKPFSQDPSYQAIYWMSHCAIISQTQVTSLISEIAREVIELTLSLPDGGYEFIPQDQLAGLPKFCKLGLKPLLNECLQRLAGWQALAPQIWSPYQRPYCFSQSEQQQLAAELRQDLGGILKGSSFRHLASTLNTDELKLAQRLQPYIQQGIVFLREPQSPFNKLPRVPDPATVKLPTSVMDVRNDLAVAAPDQSPSIPQDTAISSKTCKIACVDDSFAVLSQVTKFLGDEGLAVIAINNPMKAIAQIVHSNPNPDLILLDSEMPGMDGYELCRQLRNYPQFEKTPMIILTGHIGIIDRAKAKLAGASDYLHKPFTQEGLLNTVLKYLPH